MCQEPNATCCIGPATLNKDTKIGSGMSGWQGLPYMNLVKFSEICSVHQFLINQEKGEASKKFILSMAETIMVTTIKS